VFSEKFMRDNIVGTVIVLSLVIWIPMVCIFQSFVSVLSAYVSILSHKLPNSKPVTGFTPIFSKILWGETPIT